MSNEDIDKLKNLLELRLNHDRLYYSDNYNETTVIELRDKALSAIAEYKEFKIRLLEKEQGHNNLVRIYNELDKLKTN